MMINYLKNTKIIYWKSVLLDIENYSVNWLTIHKKNYEKRVIRKEAEIYYKLNDILNNETQLKVLEKIREKGILSKEMVYLLFFNDRI